MIEFVRSSQNWRAVADAARVTIGREAGAGEPTAAWKRRMLLAEHSPIRLLRVTWKWTRLKSWVSVHFRTHNKFAEHFVSTQRTDRTGIERDKLPQDDPVSHEIETNAAEVIFISRKRLCRQAHAETIAAWREFLEALKAVEPELAACCVPECVYRGWCPEYKPCGFASGPQFADAVKEYRK